MEKNVEVLESQVEEVESEVVQEEKFAVVKDSKLKKIGSKVLTKAKEHWKGIALVSAGIVAGFAAKAYLDRDRGDEDEETYCEGFIEDGETEYEFETDSDDDVSEVEETQE